MSEPRGERVEVDPRRAFRERKQALAEGRPFQAGLTDPPPSLLGSPGPAPARIRPISAPDPTVPDPYREALLLRVRPGKRRNGRARVRVYHVLPGAARNDEDGRCWAFTVSRAAWERLVTERVLDSDGATYPDGRPVVPPGADPMDVSVRCGSCGTYSVECLQIEFYED
jgi:hypothetical protein